MADGRRQAFTLYLNFCDHGCPQSKGQIQVLKVWKTIFNVACAKWPNHCRRNESAADPQERAREGSINEGLSYKPLWPAHTGTFLSITRIFITDIYHGYLSLGYL